MLVEENVPQLGHVRLSRQGDRFSKTSAWTPLEHAHCFQLVDSRRRIIQVVSQDLRIVFPKRRCLQIEFIITGKAQRKTRNIEVSEKTVSDGPNSSALPQMWMIHRLLHG